MYIKDLRGGETIRSIYMCRGKRSAETRNGKPYDNLLLQDKTGTLDGKVWDPNSQGIADYEEKDFIEVYGEVITYNNNLQLNIKQLRKAAEGEYDHPAAQSYTCACPRSGSRSSPAGHWPWPRFSPGGGRQAGYFPRSGRRAAPSGSLDARREKG